MVLPRLPGALISERRAEAEGPLADFVEEIRTMDPPLQRVPGTAVCLTAGKETTPLALRENVDHNHVLHESVVIVSVQTETVPHVHIAERVAVDELGYEDDGIVYLTFRYGFQDVHNVPRTLRHAAAEEGLECDADVDRATYYLSHMTIVRGDAPGMRTWRKKLFVALTRTATSPADYFCLPVNRVVTMGGIIEI